MSTSRIPPRAPARKKYRPRKSDSPWVTGLVISFCILLFVAIVVLSGLLTMLAWNIGVVGIAAALGATVGKISLGIAICANIAIGIIGRIFHGPTQVTSNS